MEPVQLEQVRRELGLQELVRQELELLGLELQELVRQELGLPERVSPVEAHDDEVEVETEDDLSHLLLHLLRLQYLVPPI